MKLTLGLKSDPIEYRYSFEWLFRLMRANRIELLQLGTFFELYSLDDAFFTDLRQQAESFGIRIKSCFTAHRELGGFFTGNPYFETVARSNYERLIAVAARLGADYAGSNPGAVYRDRLGDKASGIVRYLRHMKELMRVARDAGLKGLTIEPMSCLAEPPSTIAEIAAMMEELTVAHRRDPGGTVPVYLCGDIAHGLVDADRQVVTDNYELFTRQIPHMVEFHFKNTDAQFDATFGFSPRDRTRGVVDLVRLRDLIFRYESLWPEAEITGYLELTGPKLGRDYSDGLLEGVLNESLAELHRYLGPSSPSPSPTDTVTTVSPS